MDRAFALYEAPLLLGSVLSCPLFGITLAQTIRYFRVYSESDRLSLKLFVLALLLLDGLQTFSISSASKAIFLAAKITYGYETGILIHGYLSVFVVVGVQCFFIRRVWFVSRGNRSLTSLLITVTIIELVCWIGFYISLSINRYTPGLHSETSNALHTCALASKFTSDLLISVSSVYYLNKRRPGSGRTWSIVGRLIVYVVGIGILTCVFAAIDVITWVATQDTLLFMVFFIFLSKLYVNSMLVTLRARRDLLEASEDFGPTTEKTANDERI